MLGGNSFKPREKSKGYLPLPATFRNIDTIRTTGMKYYIGVTLLLVFLWFNPLGISSSFISKSKGPAYPPAHPFTSPHTISTSSRYIFPPIEHAPLLQQLGRKKLIRESRVRDANQPDVDSSVIKSLNVFDDPDPAAQSAKEKEENSFLDLSKAKNTFKNQDKIVYNPRSKKNYPEIVVVTAVDYEKYGLSGLTAIVQNRIDYAHKQNYGVYIRWYQEFLPWVNSFANFDDYEKRKWIRTYCLRAAMFAFPHAKWFWYLDEDGLIMNLSIDLKQYVLTDEALNPIMLREQPINPQNGIIRTYKTTKPGYIRLVITQSEEKVETDSFILRNDDTGKTMLEFWTSDLFFEYPNFPYGPDSALTHILQWHPFLLSRTAIIPARTIAAKHTTETLKEHDHIHYVKGDFTVSWTGCEGLECEELIQYYYPLVQS